MSRISCLFGFTPTQNWSTSAPANRAASTLRGAFSKREIVDCDANGLPLSGQRPTAIFNKGIVPQPIEVVPILVPTANGECPSRDQLEHLMSDACLIPMIRHHLGKPPAYAYLPFRLPKQKEPAIGGLISSIKINCEFLTADGWQIEGEQSSFGHDGCGGREYAKHLVLATDLLRESRGSCHSRHAFPHIRCIIQVSQRRVDPISPPKRCRSACSRHVFALRF